MPHKAGTLIHHSAAIHNFCGFRAMEVFDVYGVPMSEVHEAQKSMGSPGVGELRYPHTCVLWVQSEQSGKTQENGQL